MGLMPHPEHAVDPLLGSADGGLLLAALVVALLLLFRAVPGGFVPEEDQGYLMAAMQLPDAASLQRTDVVMAGIEEILAEFKRIYGQVWIDLGEESVEEGRAFVDDFLNSEDPNIRKLLGDEGEFGAKIGLPNDWAYQVIKQVGRGQEAFLESGRLLGRHLAL